MYCHSVGFCVHMSKGCIPYSIIISSALYIGKNVLNAISPEIIQNKIQNKSFFMFLIVKKHLLLFNFLFNF